MSEETKKDPQDPTPPAPNDTAGTEPDTPSITRRELISTLPKVALGVGLAAGEQQASAFNNAMMFFSGGNRREVYGLWAFGSNWAGQLGLGDTADRSRPVQVGTLSSWSEVAAGIHTVTRRRDGTLWACYVNRQPKKNKSPDPTFLDCCSFLIAA